MNKNNKCWEKLNKINKEFDNLYHLYALKNNISDSTFIVLYSLYNYEEGLTQMDICVEWNISKQTINSTIKDLKDKEYIDLINIDGKNKKIVLTTKGKEKTKCIEEIVKIENSIASKTNEEEFNKLISFYQEQLNMFKDAINNNIAGDK